MTSLLPLAIDDGTCEIKIAFLDRENRLTLHSFPTRALSKIRKVDNHTLYDLFDDTLPVSKKNITYGIPYLEAQDEEDGVRNGNYPFSEQNRVLVHHGIIQYLDRIERTGQAVSLIIGTGLSYEDAFVFDPQGGFTKNETLAIRKKKSIADPVYRCDLACDPISFRKPFYTINHHLIISGGIAAFYALMFRIGIKGTVELDKDFSKRFEKRSRFVLVDIGDKTTSVIFGNWNGQGNDFIKEIRNCATLNMGMADIYKELSALLSRQPAIKGIRLGDREVEVALMEKQVSYYGERIDITVHVNQCYRNFIEKLYLELQYPLCEGIKPVVIIFTGGGAEAMASFFKERFDPETIMIPKLGRFANVVGLLSMLLLYKASLPGSFT